MSYKKATKAALEKNACSHYWHAVCELMAISRPAAFLAALISLSCLLGVATPTSTWAQTASGLPLDANGWTVFTPSSDTHIIYVSDSTGNDSTGVIGDSTHPYKTLAQGVSLLRNGYPDWLLLKKGDIWTNQSLSNLYVSGRSATEPMLFSSYGSGPQPQVRPSAALYQNGIGSAYGYTASNIAVVDIDFYAYLRDPSGPNTEGAMNMEGAFWNNASQNWLLFEGCKFRFFTDGVNTNVTNTDRLPQHSIQTLVFRRNIVVDNHPGSGFGTADTINFTMDENLFDQNYTVSGAGSGRRVQQHNFYIAGYYPDSANSGVPQNSGLTAF